MPEKIEYNEQGCFKLIAYTIAGCFREGGFKSREKSDHEKKINRKFATKGKLLNLFCDCSDNFEIGKLKNKILKANE